MYQPDIENMELPEIRKLQSDRFVKMVKYAYDNVPMYKKKFDDAGINPDDIKGLEDAHKVPFTVKDDLRQMHLRPPVTLR